jgi:hypothetical protein
MCKQGNQLFTRRCVGKIAALLQAFGLSVGSWGLANVLQCAVDISNLFFLFSSKL